MLCQCPCTQFCSLTMSRSRNYLMTKTEVLGEVNRQRSCYLDLLRHVFFCEFVMVNSFLHTLNEENVIPVFNFMLFGNEIKMFQL